MERTSIQVSEELADELHNRKDSGESYENMIWTLIERAEAIPLMRYKKCGGIEGDIITQEGSETEQRAAIIAAIRLLKSRGETHMKTLCHQVEQEGVSVEEINLQQLLSNNLSSMSEVSTVDNGQIYVWEG